ncbi:MAG: type II toxin-antitoxin system VapC family toxin [Chloroflexi bacterium]|nr:type II toxin-antitoxin system VapC family toxin [Chloroflexota bacterium]
MTTTGGKAFVDTNVFLRANIVGMDGYTECDALIKRYWREGAELWISGQVIREFLVQVTHPNTMKTPLAIEEVVALLRAVISLFRVADETTAVRAELLNLLVAYPAKGKQVHDANLVATTLVYGIDTLLTINVDDLKRFKDRIALVSAGNAP